MLWTLVTLNIFCGNTFLVCSVKLVLSHTSCISIDKTYAKIFQQSVPKQSREDEKEKQDRQSQSFLHHTKTHKKWNFLALNVKFTSIFQIPSDSSEEGKHGKRNLSYRPKFQGIFRNQGCIKDPGKDIWRGFFAKMLSWFYLLTIFTMVSTIIRGVFGTDSGFWVKWYTAEKG